MSQKTKATIKKTTFITITFSVVVIAIVSFFNISLFPPQVSLQEARAATEEIGLVRQDCTGYSNCYTSLSAWEAAYGGIDFTGCTVGDLTCVDKIAVAKIDGAWTSPDTTAVAIDGWITDATRYIRIYTTEEARHDGKWNEDGAYRLERNHSEAVRIQEDYVIVDGLQILQSSATAAYVRGFLVSDQNVSNEITISNCILKAEASGTANNWDVIRVSDADLIIKFYNNIAYDWVNGANTMNGFRDTGASAVYLYNNTFINIYSYAFSDGGERVIAKNNITQNCPDGFSGTFHAFSDYNISDIAGDTTGISSSYREGLVTDVSFVDEDGDDFHLSVSDTSAKDQGTDLSGTFTTDIDRETRTGTWDIGADENGEVSQTCTEAGGTCKTNLCSTYINCSSLSGTCATGNCCSGTCTDDTTSPIISIISSSSITQNSAVITWTTDEDSTSQVEYGQTTSYGFQTTIDTNLITSHSVNLTGLSSGAIYHYRVKSKDASNNEAVSSDYTFITIAPDTEAPTVPTNLSATVISSSQINLSWTASTDNVGVSGYNIYRDAVLVDASATNSYSDTGLSAETTYTYIVSAYDAVPNTSGQSTEAQAITQVSTGNTYYVDNDSINETCNDSYIKSENNITHPWCTIQHATDVLVAGDTVIVQAGNYSERVTTQASGTNQSNRITFKVSGDVVMRGFRLNHDYITIDGFDITNTPTGGAGISCGVYAGSGSDYCEILNCNIYDTAIVEHAEGIFMSTASPFASNYLIQGNTIYRTYNTGIMALGNGHSIIDNEIYDIRHPGAGDTDACRFFGDNQTWRGNYIHDVSTYAFGHTDAWQSWCDNGKPSTSNLLIEDNIVDTVCPLAGGGGGMSIIAFNGDFCALGSNVNWTIRNNVFRPNCSVLPGSHTGFIYNVNGLYIYNNTFIDGGNATSMRIAPMCRNIEVKNNLYYKSPHTIDSSVRPYTTVSDNWCTTLSHTLCDSDKFQTGDGINTTESPGFADYVNHDYHLTADSPLRNIGTTISGFTTDKDGTTRPQGISWDIGAYEYLQASVCGDSACNGAETCLTCPEDCGACPPPDTTPPTATISINSSELINSQNTSLNISATDPSGVTEMKISNTNDFNTAVTEAYNTFKIWILTAGDELKIVYAWFKDSLGNWTSEANPVIDTITLDETAPGILNIGILNITANSAQINFTTDELTTSYLEYGLTTSYGSQTEVNSSGIMNYELGIMDLSDNTTYNFRITSTDEANNTSQSINYSFTTEEASTPDTTSPANITNLSSSNITQTSASLNWTAPGDDNNTGTASAYDLRYSTSNITNDTEFNSATELSGEPNPQVAGTEQSFYIAVGLYPNTSYYFAIKTADEVPNISNLSNILSITTLTESTPPNGGGGGGGGTYSDTTPPAQPDEFTATPAESQITLTWNNPTNSDFVRVKILRKENEAPTSHNDETATIIYEGTNKEYTDIDLDNNKTYYYAIFAYDQKPNYSEVLTISAQPEEGKTTIEIPNTTYPDGTLIKIPESFKVYLIINQKRKWIPTPEVFETLGYQWENIIITTKTKLNRIPNYEDNLIRAINNYKVYLVVNGISRHIPNPEIFLDYGFSWDDVVDVPQETIDQYQRAYLIRESRQGKIYYLRDDGIKKHIPTAEVFNSYNNKWEDIQVISKPEMESYIESNLIQLSGDNKVYLLEGNVKRYIFSANIFNKHKFNWDNVVRVNEVEFGIYIKGEDLR